MPPDCWSEEKWTEKQEQFPWLKLVCDGGLICKACHQTKRLLGASKSSRIRKEWTECGVFANGDTKTQKLTSLRKKITEHMKSEAHKEAVASVDIAKEDHLRLIFDSVSGKSIDLTANIFRCAYMLAKLNRPYTDMPHYVSLCRFNGANMGIGLQSRMSATEIVSVISKEMLSRLLRCILTNKQKISLIIDESTSIAKKSILAMYIRTAFPLEEQFKVYAFPVALVELDSLEAEHITESVLCTLKSFGFTDQYLKDNLIGVCADGASTMVGNQSGVLTRIRAKYPHVLLWHCMCHRIELAVGDAVDSSNQMNHVKSFLDKLYTVYNQPKNQRELADCAGSLDMQIQRIGRVLDVR